MGDYDNIRCYVVLNITQGFGNIVLNNIHDADIPALIDSKLEGHGKVIHSEEKWDSGILSHDLHLYYELNINCYRLIKAKKNKVLAKILKWTGMQKSIIKSVLEESIEEGFMKELNGRQIIVRLKSCDVV
jgi:hypothetical protein